MAVNWLDIVIIVLLIAAAVQGWRQGVIVQVIGLVAIVCGILLARNLCGPIGELFGLEGTVARVAGFAAVLLVVILVVALIGRATRGLSRIVGLGVFDSIFGAAFSVLKVWLLVWVVLNLFQIESRFNTSLWISDLWA